MPTNGHERRRHLRVEIPLDLRVIGPDNAIYTAKTKNISPLGFRFESRRGDIKVNSEIELKIDIPEISRSVHAKAKVVWRRKLSQQDGAPYDVGCEFIKIEEDSKNTFLNFLCNLLHTKKHK